MRPRTPTTPPDLRERLRQLTELTDNCEEVSPQDRGYLLERLLRDLLSADGLSPRAAYRTEGEQLDGSFLHGGRVFLLEAKWHAEPLPASAVYDLRGKVDGKLVGTLGVFVSMSGYSPSAADEVSRGKAVNVLLFDREDIEAALATGVGFRRVLDEKLRAAAEEGVVYHQFRAEQPNPNRGPAEAIARNPLMEELGIAPRRYVLVVCEDRTDRQILAVLVQKLVAETFDPIDVDIVTSYGLRQLPAVARARMRHARFTDVILVASGRGRPEKIRRQLRRLVDFTCTVVVVTDDLNDWWRRGVPPEKGPMGGPSLASILHAVDIEYLSGVDAAFKEFRGAVVSPRPAA